MTDVASYVRTELGNYFRGYNYFFEDKPGKIEFTLYMVINGQNHRLDMTVPTTDDVGVDEVIAELKHNFRLDIATMWILSPTEQTDFLFAQGKFADASGAISVRVVDSEYGDVLAELTERRPPDEG
jgi:hypothetical protein